MKTFEEIKKDIENGKLAPVYLFDGEEPYFSDILIGHITDTVPESQREFSIHTYVGKEAKADEVINTARQFSMFGDKVLVVVRDASKMTDLKAIAEYVKAPQPSTILVLDHRLKKVDGRSQLPKIVGKTGVYFTTKKINEDKIPEWVMDFCRQNESQISLENAQLLVSYLGQDLQHIVNELQKIWINKEEGREITAEKITRYIGVNRDYNIFELPQILFLGNDTRLAQMLNYFSVNPKAGPMPVIIGAFYSFLERTYLAQAVPPNFTKDRQLGIWKHHRLAGQRYAPFQVHRCVAVVEEFAHKSIGIGAGNKDGLLMEMVGKLKSVLRN